MTIGIKEIPDKLAEALMQGKYTRFGNPFRDFAEVGEMNLTFGLQPGEIKGNLIGVPKVKDGYSWTLFKSCIDLCFSGIRVKPIEIDQIELDARLKDVIAISFTDNGLHWKDRNYELDIIVSPDCDSWCKISYKDLERYLQDKKLMKVGWDLKFLATKNLGKNRGVWIDVMLAGHWLNNNRPQDLGLNTLELVPNLNNCPDSIKVMGLWNAYKNRLTDYFFVNVMSTMFLIAELMDRGVEVNLDILENVIKLCDGYIEDLRTDLAKEFEDWKKEKAKELLEGVVTRGKRKEAEELALVSGLEGSELLKFVFPELKSYAEKSVRDTGKHKKLVDCYFRLERLKRLKKNNIDAISENLIDGRVYPVYNQTTDIVRIMTSNPNLQGFVSRKRSDCKYYSEVFDLLQNIFGKDHVLLNADFSQLELRVLAGLSGDQNMIQAFRDEIDLHENTAAKGLAVSVKELREMEGYKNYRAIGKEVNFGQIFGQGEKGLVENLSNQGILISSSRAKEMQDGFWTAYPQTKEYQNKVVANHKKNKFGRSFFGRIRYKSFSTTIAKHTPVVTTAAELMLLWVRLCQLAGIDVQLMVHDSIRFSEREDWKGLDRGIAKQIGMNLNTEFYYGKRLPVKFDVEVD